MLAQNNG